MLAGKVIAIDGIAGAGKGAIAKALVKKYSVMHLDTGLLFRYLAFYLLSGDRTEDYLTEAFKGFSWNDLNDKRLLTTEVSQKASDIATLPDVRHVLLAMQRSFIVDWIDKTGVVLDGRDIGVTVYPQANFKFFILCPIAIRAQRRQHQLFRKGYDIPIKRIKEDLYKRDMQDKNRAISPLAKSDDAIIIHNIRLVKTVKKICSIIDTA